MREFLVHLFFPHRRNNFKARLLHPSFLTLLIGIFLLNQIFLNFIVLAKPGVLGYSSNITAEAIVELTNKEREKQGLPLLKVSPLLNEAAQRKAADMFAFDYWAHTSPTGRSPWEFFKEVGYNYVVAGENLAKDFPSPEAVVAAWMKSPTHRANIMDPRFREIGVAVVKGELGGYKTTLVVQLFGARSAYGASLGKEQKKGELLTSIKDSIIYTTRGSTAIEESKQESLISPLTITKGVSIFLFGVVIGVLLVDAYYILRTKIHRLSGKSLAHAGFLIIILMMVLLSQPGVIN